MVLEFGAQRSHLFNLIAVISTLLCEPVLNNVNLGGRGLWEDLQKLNEKSICVHVSDLVRAHPPTNFIKTFFY